MIRILFVLRGLVILMLSIPPVAQAQQEDGLPFEPDTTLVKLKPISNQANKMAFEFHLDLPPSQKLNKGAPSFLGIYEKGLDGKWTLLEKFDLNQVPSLTPNELALTKTFEPKTKTQPLAVFSTIYHCGKDHKSPCYIQGFKGIAQRSPNSSRSIIPFRIKGVMK